MELESGEDLDGNGNIVSISEERNPYITNQIMDVVDVINQRTPQGPLQGLASLTAIFQKLYVIDDNNQIADQLQLHELPPDDPYGLSTSSFKKQTAQKLICNHLMKSTCSQIQCMLNLWVKQLSCVINRTSCRTIIAGTAALVDAVNASSRDDLTSTQRDDQLAANSTAARNFIEDLDLSLINHEHRQH